MTIGSTATTSDQVYAETASEPSRPKATLAPTSSRRISMPSPSAERSGAPVEARIAASARLLTAKNTTAAIAAAPRRRGEGVALGPAIAWKAINDSPTPVSTCPKLKMDLNQGRCRTSWATTIADAKPMTTVGAGRTTAMITRKPSSRWTASDDEPRNITNGHTQLAMTSEVRTTSAAVLSRETAGPPASAAMATTSVPRPARPATEIVPQAAAGSPDSDCGG